MKRDRTMRVSQARVDDDRHRAKIASARSIIYDKGYAVNSKPVENILKEQSLVANFVSSGLT
jgi:hypothetical protein